MFLMAITKDGIANKFHSGKIEEFLVHSLNVTVITDDFLSGFFSEPDGFSVIESPLIKNPDFHKIIYFKITYELKDDTVTLFKSTVSGRPIYYHINSEGEFFCSTHISLLRTAGIVIEENIKVLPEFFVFRFVLPPNTLYKDIFQLCTGQQLQIKFTNNKASLYNIYNYIPPEPGIEIHTSNIIKKTLYLLDKSIKNLSAYNSKISVLFSGGLDSSILFKLCNKNFKVNTTFSTSYPFKKSNDLEKEYSLSAASVFKTKHYFLDMTNEDYLLGFLEAISKAELPVHHLQSIPIYLLFKKIPADKNIVVSGLGADDIFGTSTQYNLFRVEKNIILKFLAKYHKFVFINYFSHLNNNINNYLTFLKNYQKINYQIADVNNILWSIGAYGSEEWAAQYFKIPKEDIIKYRYNQIKDYTNRSIYDIISILLFLGSATTTQAIWSKLGEGENKILYYPFSDVDLINYTFSIPWNIKLKKQKNILRFIANQVDIPVKIINRPKSAFGVDPSLWAQKGGVFESLIKLTTETFNKDEIRKMQSTDLKKAMIYWNMLNYAIWKRLCIKNEPLRILLEEIE